MSKKGFQIYIDTSISFQFKFVSIHNMLPTDRMWYEHVLYKSCFNYDSSGYFPKGWYVQDKNSTGETSLEPFLKVIKAREGCVVFMRRPNDETSQGDVVLHLHLTTVPRPKKHPEELPSLKLTAKTPLKMDGWKIRFLLGPGFLAGANC